MKKLELGENWYKKSKIILLFLFILYNINILLFINMKNMEDITEKAEKIANIMKSFSNKNKLLILCFLWNEKKNVSEIMKCSKISQSQISQYLWKMKLEWILESNKNWKEVFYKISDEKILKLIDSMKNIFAK